MAHRFGRLADRRRVRRRASGVGAAVLVTAALLTGCSASNSSTSSTPAAGSASNSSGRAGTGDAGLNANGVFGAGGRGGWDCPGGTCAWGPDPAERAAFDALSSGVATGRSPGTTAGPQAPSTVPSPRPAVATIDDNEDFAGYLRYRDEFARANPGGAVLPLPIEGRQIITVSGSDGRPVLGATVDIADERGLPVAHLETGADGRVAFFPLPVPDATTGRFITYAATVAAGGASQQVTLPPGTPAISVVLAGAVGTPSPAPMDILFLVDTTTSMGDELAELQASFAGIAAQLAAPTPSVSTAPTSSVPAAPVPAAPGRDVRFALTTYRDRGDLFVTHTFDFTPDVAQFGSALGEVGVGGGGDTAEDLQAGLDAALTTPTWRGAGTTKLVIIITDAPPHLDYAGEVTYLESIQTATAHGIRISSVGATGLDARGTYVLRQLAQATLGRHVPPARVEASTSGRGGSGFPPGALAAAVADEIDAA